MPNDIYNPQLSQLRAALRSVQRRRRHGRYWRPVLCACGLCLLLFRLIIGIEVVSGASMMPALLSGDIIVYQRVGTKIQLGDMVVIASETKVDVLKRVVAVAGDTVAVDADGHMIRNGLAELEPFVWYGWQDSGGWVDFPMTVEDDHIFYMGDNRAVSLDSRTDGIGAVPISRVSGKVLFVFSWRG